MILVGEQGQRSVGRIRFPRVRQNSFVSLGDFSPVEAVGVAVVIGGCVGMSRSDGGRLRVSLDFIFEKQSQAGDG